MARRRSEQIGELIDPDDAAVACYAGAGGWIVEISLSDGGDEDAILAVVASIANAHPGTLIVETVAQQDWLERSLAGLPAVSAGRFVVHGSHHRALLPPSRIAIEIEAALAFGTGHHGTTRGCLHALDTVLSTSRPRRILDIGTGSGVLAMAAAKATRAPVLGTDIDPIAVRSARRNARHNLCGPSPLIIQADGLRAPEIRSRAPYDLVLANILLQPLRRLATPLRAIAAPGCRVVLSGLLVAQTQGALDAYRAAGFILERRWALEGWATLLLRRPPRGCAR